MKDGFDMITDVRSLINVPAITALLNGGNIYPDTRPAGRADRTDIVINSIGINNAQQQQGTPNINIYAPNIRISQPGGVHYAPNYTVFNALVKALLPLVENQYRNTFNTKVVDPGTLLQDADGSWFVSMQLQYQSIQNNYPNI